MTVLWTGAGEISVGRLCHADLSVSFASKHRPAENIKHEGGRLFPFQLFIINNPHHPAYPSSHYSKPIGPEVRV